MEFEDRRDWVPIIPVPKEAPSIIFEIEINLITTDPFQNPAYLDYQFNEGSIIVEAYPYMSAKNELMGYIVRLVKDGKKRLPTLTYCEHSEGRQRWYWRSFSESYIYNLPRLLLYPERPVLIVEGEKTCNIAQELFPDYCVITWYGGSGAVTKPDWNILKGRRITLWPDADPVGRDCMRVLEGLLPQFGVYNIATIEHQFNRASLSLGWDLADPLPAEWEGAGVIQNVLEDKRLVYIDFSQDSHAVNREPTL